MLRRESLERTPEIGGYESMEKALTKAVRRYGEETSQENYTKVIHELFWSMVNKNIVYYVVDATCDEHIPQPSKAIGGDGKAYAVIFTRPADILDEPDLDVAADDMETLAGRLILRDDIAGIVLDIDTGSEVIVLTNYLATILGSVHNYREGLEK